MTRLTVSELFSLRAAGPLAVGLLDRQTQPARHGETFEETTVQDTAPGLLSRLGTYLSRARDRREVIGQLGRLDDRLLRDIGLERGTLVEAVDAALEKRAPAWALESLSEFGRALVAPIVRWHRTAVTLGELEQLDDRLLADIGLSRSELHYVATSKVDPRQAANDDQPRRAA